MTETLKEQLDRIAARLSKSADSESCPPCSDDFDAAQSSLAYIQPLASMLANMDNLIAGLHRDVGELIAENKALRESLDANGGSLSVLHDTLGSIGRELEDLRETTFESGAEVSSSPASGEPRLSLGEISYLLQELRKGNG